MVKHTDIVGKLFIADKPLIRLFLVMVIFHSYACLKCFRQTLTLRDHSILWIIILILYNCTYGNKLFACNS